jgi:hypothetical protein
MKRRSNTLVLTKLVVVVAITCQFAMAGVKIVIMKAKAPELAGEVQFDDPGMPAEGVTVQLCEKEWKNCAVTVLTDSKGMFKFEGVKPKGVNYLLIKWQYANWVEMELRIDKKAKPLVLVLRGG